MIEVDFLLARSHFTMQLQQVFSGGITGIFGPSGSGKSSLLKSIAGLEKPQKGVISIRGVEVYNSTKNFSVPVFKRRIGYVFQDGRLFHHMNIKKNLMYGMKAGTLSTVSYDQIVELLQISHTLQRKPTHISGGEYQRVAIGRALLRSPDALLLDEPFSAVDTHLRSQILPYLLMIQKQFAIPLLVVSHELTDILKLTDTLCVLDRGKCLGHGSYDQLIQSSTASPVLVSSSDSIMNALTLTVVDVDTQKGLATLATQVPENVVRIVCQKCKRAYRSADRVKIFLKSNDIALSLEKITGTTMQNQIPGTIRTIFQRGGSTFCVVDAGVQLIAEITHDSKERMNLAPGKKVWCLFKSIAIDVAS